MINVFDICVLSPNFKCLPRKTSLTLPKPETNSYLVCEKLTFHHQTFECYPICICNCCLKQIFHVMKTLINYRELCQIMPNVLFN